MASQLMMAAGLLYGCRGRAGGAQVLRRRCLVCVCAALRVCVCAALCVCVCATLCVCAWDLFPLIFSPTGAASTLPCSRLPRPHLRCRFTLDCKFSIAAPASTLLCNRLPPLASSSSLSGRPSVFSLSGWCVPQNSSRRGP